MKINIIKLFLSLSLILNLSIHTMEQGWSSPDKEEELEIDNLTHATGNLAIAIPNSPAPIVQQDPQKLPPSSKKYTIPDDVSKPTYWVTVKGPHYQLPDIFNIENHEIRNRLSYNLPSATSNSLIVFIVVHGTFGRTTDSYFVDENKTEESNNFRHIKYFASYYSTYKNKKLELLSYKWSGFASNTARTNAAKILSNFLHYMNYDTTAEIVTLSHSHGANLLNIVSRSIKKPIELMIHFACPRKTEYEYQPANYRMLIYIFSDMDFIAHVG